MYIVWRRADGYINASNATSRAHWEAWLGSDRRTFEVLLETEDWPTARALIEAERETSPSTT